jgi:23S rRNA (uracil1939-C5)-methyltransferase
MPVIHISELSWGGEGIGRIDGKVVFVPQALPGEDAEIEIIQSKKDYSRGKIKRMLAPSPDRVEPPCPVYQDCGGCQLQHLSYPKQVQEKERLFKKALHHALRGRDVFVFPSLNSPKKYGYRHRLLIKTAWSKKKLSLGFFKPKSHELVSIDRCLLANESVNALINPLRDTIQALGKYNFSPEIELQVFEDPTRGGVVFSSSSPLNLFGRKKIIKDLCGLGLNYLLFQAPKSLMHGDGTLFSPEKESPEFILPAATTGLPQDIRLTAFPKVFTQINLDTNLLLLARLLQMDLFRASDRILDCFCGLGNFSLPASFKAKEVIGLESLPLAVANARWNQNKNEILNCSFIQAKADSAFRQTGFPQNPVSLMILDPPRTGVKELIPLLNFKDLDRLLYVSCNPSTLFRDLNLFIVRGWAVEWSQTVDFFPQTFHLESVTLLRKNHE